MNVNPVFIDTNIFVYAMQNIKKKEKSLQKSEEEDNKRKIAKNFLETVENPIIISTQVLNEFSNVLIRNKIENQRIRNLVKAIIEECVIIYSIDLKSIDRAWDIRIRYNYSYWDSLIISTALLSGCSILYTEDLQNNQVIDNQLKIVNPLL